jgi:hypothetical protein
LRKTTIVLITLAAFAAQAPSARAYEAPPAPHPVPVIHKGVECPGLPYTPCYFPHGDIYLPDPSCTFCLQHELGHAVDFTDLSDGGRARIQRVIGWRVWHREAFADIYASCRLRLDPADEFNRAGNDFHHVAVRRVPGVCALIARAAS